MRAPHPLPTHAFLVTGSSAPPTAYDWLRAPTTRECADPADVALMLARQAEARRLAVWVRAVGEGKAELFEVETMGVRR